VVTTLDLEAPSVPENLFYSDLTSKSLTLSWDASADNAGVTGYEVYKDEVLIATVAVNSIHITKLIPATSYRFAVRATDKAGNISDSSSLQVTTLPRLKSAPDMDLNNDSILIYPNPASDNVNIQLSQHSIVKIMDVSGKILVDKTFEPGINNIPLKLEPGLYIIQVFGENNSIYRSKLIVR